MKKIFLAAAVCLLPLSSFAEDAAVSSVLPLLQKTNKTVADINKITNELLTSKDSGVIAAAGYSLVGEDISARNQERLFSAVMSDADTLRSIISAIVLSSEGEEHRELVPTIKQALNSDDKVLRAYAAAAYSFIMPEDTFYSEYVVSLYPYNQAFTLKTLRKMFHKTTSMQRAVKNAAKSGDAFIRTSSAQFLADEHDTAALFNMLKKEEDSSVTAVIARGIAENAPLARAELKACLKEKPKSNYALGCTLALGFMTGDALDIVEEGLKDGNKNAVANSLRTVSVMANTLSSPDAAAFSSDVEFDKQRLKALIPTVAPLAQSKTPEIQTHADAAAKALKNIFR